MTVYDLWKVTPQAYIFVVKKDSAGRLKRYSYHGPRTGAFKDVQITKVTPTTYPNYGHVLEVEVEKEV